MLPPRIVVPTIFIVACVVFYNALPNDFAFDDHLAIVNNGDTDPEAPWIELLRNDIWGKNLRAVDSHRSYRPLLVVIFKLIRIRYGLNATAYRYFSILCHALASVLVYFCSVEIVGSSDLSAVAAALFATHPVHVESVTAVVNLAEPVSCCFYVAAFLIYRADITAAEEIINRSAFRSAGPSFLWLFCVVVASLIKETGITAAGIVFADCAINLVSVLAFYRSDTTRQKNAVYRWVHIRIWWFLVAAASLALYAALRVAIIKSDIVDLAAAVGTVFSEWSAESVVQLISLWGWGGHGGSLYLGSSDLIRKAENPFAFLDGRKEKFLSMMYLHFRYLYVLLFPVELCAEYAFDCIQKVSDFADVRNIYTFLMYGFVILLLIYEFYGLRQRCPKQLAAISRPSEMQEMSECTMLKPEALLVALSWFVVTFIPISGVFLTLGTLLAERLLYIPSIGFCILFAILLHRILGYLLMFIGKSQSTVQIQMQAVLFSTAVLVSFFSMRTIQRNLDWANDAKLHLSSLEVCPRSAKLNLQVAKLRMSDMNLTGARWHVDRAKEIDPDFCDTDFQYAMLALHQNDYEKAVPYLVKSLKCIYTNMQAWPMLNQIWESQIKSSNGNSRVYEHIGSLLNETGLYVVSARQFLTGASRAYDESNYQRSIRLLRRAEETIERLSLEVIGADDSAENSVLFNSLQMQYRELQCHSNALGGTIRSTLEVSSDKIDAKDRKRLSGEFERISDLLFAAVDPQCVIIDTQSGRVSQFPLLALQQLQSRLPPDVQTNLASYFQYGRVLDAAMKIQSAYYELTGDKEYEMVVRQLFPTALKTWQAAGEAYFNQREYATARRCFESALAYDQMSLVQGNVVGHVSCSVYYWYAHAIAGEPSFLDDTGDVATVMKALLHVINCQNGMMAEEDEEMKVLAGSQLNMLMAFMNEEEIASI